MKISYNWLRNYVRTDLPAEKAAELLTGCGLEVENLEKWQSVKGGLEGVVIGEVLTCVKHPGSDHLSLTTVNVGSSDPLHIVCGAPNVEAGQKVPVAMIGATLYFNDKELVIQRTKIRGEVSEGMICAEDELGLGISHAGIMVLDPSAVPGTPAKEYFGVEEDYIFEIGLTPNRSDAASHIGVARDLVAVLNNFGKNDISEAGHALIEVPDVSTFRKDTDGRKIGVVIDDPKGNPRYSGLTITGITVRESPEWMQNRLKAIGLRPINNIVDITNFILYEVGQPLHAFDADRIQGDTVVIRRAEKGTKFITLDEIERELTAEDLMICNTKEPMCIAGVFGGIHSGVTHETKNIFLESAYFDPVSIRKTSRHHGLQTDASFRFERGANYDITLYALKRAALLIKEIAGGTVSSDIVDVYPSPREKQVIRLRYSYLDMLAGQQIDRGIVANILLDLGMETEDDKGEGIIVTVPPYKVDVTREADLVEEILRVYGYNNIDIPVMVRMPLTHMKRPDPDQLRNIVSDLLCSTGYTEIQNNSLTRSSYYEGFEAYPPEGFVRILNPISRDLDIMRRNLLFGGLETIVYNQNRRIADLKLFEFGSIYSKAGPEDSGDPLPGYHEERRLAMFQTGLDEAENWNSQGKKVDFFGLKEDLEGFLAGLNIPVDGFTVLPYHSSEISEGVVYRTGDKDFARLGSVSKTLLKRFDCRQEVFFADMCWDLVYDMAQAGKTSYDELPKFPEVRRDLALLVDSAVTFEEMKKIAFQAEKRILRQVGLFDVYEGEKIETGKKSYALKFILQDTEKTLTDQEIDRVMQKLISAFEKQCGATIR